MLPPALAGVAAIEWQQAGSEIEALLREAVLIRDLQPVVNVQTAAPTLATRVIPRSLVQDVVLLVPSIDPDAAELVAARDDGATMLHRTRRSGAEIAQHSRELWRPSLLGGSTREGLRRHLRVHNDARVIEVIACPAELSVAECVAITLARYGYQAPSIDNSDTSPKRPKDPSIRKATKSQGNRRPTQT